MCACLTLPVSTTHTPCFLPCVRYNYAAERVLQYALAYACKESYPTTAKNGRTAPPNPQTRNIHARIIHIAYAFLLFTHG